MMPELPEVETTVRALAPEVTSWCITSIWYNSKKKLRHPYPKQTEWNNLLTKTITGVKRIGKYILFSFKDSDLVLVFHLGMSGYLRINQEEEKNMHDHVIISMSRKTKTNHLTYNDPRRFGLVILKDKEEFTASLSLGIDALSYKLKPIYLYKKAITKSISIKNFLLDQSIISGIGNIYASEILYHSRIKPQAKANKITINQWKTVIKHTIQVLKHAIKAGGSTIKNFKNPHGKLGYFSLSHMVYDKEGQTCSRCSNSSIIRRVGNQRSSFYCPNCQK